MSGPLPSPSPIEPVRGQGRSLSLVLVALVVLGLIGVVVTSSSNAGTTPKQTPVVGGTAQVQLPAVAPSVSGTCTLREVLDADGLKDLASAGPDPSVPSQVEYDEQPPAAREALQVLSLRVRAGVCDVQTGPAAYWHVRQWADDTSGQGVNGTSSMVLFEIVQWRTAERAGQIRQNRYPAQAGEDPTFEATYKPGEMEPAFPQVPAEAGPLTQVLRATRPMAEVGSGGWLQAVCDLYLDGAPSRDVRASTISILAAHSSGLVYRGRVTDRAGRTGIGVSADSPDGSTRDLLILDDTTGAVLAYEMTLLRKPSRLSIRVPRVTNYLLFLTAIHTPMP